MKTTASSYPARNPRHYSRHTRAGLVALLLCTLLLAGGALLAKLKLEDFREQVLRYAETRIGGELRVGSIEVDGVRGLRIHGLEASFRRDTGESAVLNAPELELYLDLRALLIGRVRISSLNLTGARLAVDSPSGMTWIKSGAFLPMPGKSSAPSLASFHITGKDCTVAFTKGDSAMHLSLAGLRFDIRRGGPDGMLDATVSGDLSGDPAKGVTVACHGISLNDFTVTAKSQGITAADIGDMFPKAAGFLLSGTTTPTLRASSGPANTLMISLKAPFQNVQMKAQPEFLAPFDGTLSAVAEYDPSARSLSFTTAQLSSNQLQGSLGGSISFADTFPHFDLEVQATDIPVEQVLAHALKDRIAPYGALAVSLKTPQELSVSLTGTAAEPELALSASCSGGLVSFSPASPKFPEATLQLGPMRFAWDSKTRLPMGSVNITAGAVDQPTYSVKADNLSGFVKLEGTQVSVEPLNASITGNQFVGNAAYDLKSRVGQVSVSGVVSGLEDSALHSAFHNTLLAGSASVQGTAKIAPGKYEASADVDATQAQIGVDWWFKKPIGIGAKCTLRAEVIPDKTITYNIDADVAASTAQVTGKLRRVGGAKGKWRLMNADATAPHLDVATIGRCLMIPYRVTGGTGTNATFSWVRTPGSDSPKDWRSTAHCEVDQISLLPDGGTEPMSLSGAVLDTTITKGDNPTGTLTLHAADATMPPFRSKWFPPLRSRVMDNEALMEMYPSVPRPWTYSLSADHLVLPPWQGTEFRGEAYANETEGGFTHYEADIDEGHLLGTFRNFREENLYEMSADWTDVPLNYFVEQLNFPKIVTGNSTGKVHYSVDRDDPNTLNGGGTVSMESGQLDSGLLFSHLGAKLDDELAGIPASFPFDHLKLDYAFHGDQVETPVLQMASPGLDISGSGKFVRDGDMDYDIKVAVSPDMADKVPLISSTFNVQGHRIAQQKIEMAFRITGPTFRPKGELAELPPASVTLVSGALEVTSEAIKVIDMPRRILVDLLKTAGGIMGASK